MFIPRDNIPVSCNEKRSPPPISHMYMTNRSNTYLLSIQPPLPPSFFHISRAIIGGDDGNDGNDDDNDNGSTDNKTKFILAFAVGLPILIILAGVFWYMRRRAGKKYGATRGFKTAGRPQGSSRRRAGRAVARHVPKMPSITKKKEETEEGVAPPPPTYARPADRDNAPPSYEVATEQEWPLRSNV